MVKTSLYLTQQHGEILFPLGISYTHCPGIPTYHYFSEPMADSALAHYVSTGGALRFSAQTFLFSPYGISSRS